MESETRRRRLDLVLGLDLNFRRTILDQIRVEMEKRDKILHLLVTGGDVTLLKNEETGTKTFELLTREIPYKVETVTLNPLNWDDLINSLGKGDENEKEPGENFYFYQDTKSNPKSTQGNDLKIFPLPAPVTAKRRLPDSDKTAVPICEPVGKQRKLEKKYHDFLTQLPEYLMDSSFFDKENPSTNTSKFIIRLHDYNLDKICVYEINQDLKSTSQKSVSVFQLSLQEIQEQINAHKNSHLQIWCSVKNFDIFSVSLQPFFRLYGNFVSHFTFSLRFSRENPKSFSSSIDSSLLVGFILENFPSLEFLSINSEMLKNLSQLHLNLTQKTFKLECLKTLKIIPSIKHKEMLSAVFLAKLLKKTPTLESVYGFPLNCVKETAEMDQISMEDAIMENHLLGNPNPNPIGSSIPKLAIRSCFLLKNLYHDDFNKYPNDLFNLHSLKTGTGSKTGTGRMIVALEQFNAQRHFIHDPAIREKLGHLISRILETNKKSMMKLVLEANSNPQSALAIPRLENLKILRFEFVKTNFSSFFPRGFQVNHNFPKLEQVEMLLVATPQQQHQTLQSDSNISPEFLRYGETFTTVKILSFSQIIPPDSSLMKIRSMFPNLTRLTLHNTLAEVSRFLPKVFLHFSHLHQLILEIAPDSRHGNLDAALTGIPADLCKKLEKPGFVPCPMDKTGKENLLKIIQNGQSLADLKELRLLKFVLRPGAAREFNKIPVLTPVSFEYGLGAEGREKVDIFLEFHERTTREVKSEILTALEPILPYLTVL